METYAALKDTLVKSGASLSHHHGIGKRGQQKFSQYLPNTSRSILKAIKKDVDPKNVFGVGNLIFNESCSKLESKL
jgi:alkyldihydroxyacetonephosphate synthase